MSMSTESILYDEINALKDAHKQLTTLCLLLKERVGHLEESLEAVRKTNDKSGVSHD